MHARSLRFDELRWTIFERLHSGLLLVCRRACPDRCLIRLAGCSLNLGGLARMHALCIARVSTYSRNRPLLVPIYQRVYRVIEGLYSEEANVDSWRHCSLTMTSGLRVLTDADSDI